MRPTNLFVSLLIGSVCLHVIWIALAYTLSSPALPQPWQVYRLLPSMLTTSALWVHLGASMRRITWAILCSLFLSGVLAWAMYRYRRFGEIFDAFIYFSYPIPKLALLPIVMLLMGIGEGSKISMMVLILLFQLVVGIRDSLRSIPEEDLLLARSLGANACQELRHILLPASLPGIFSSLRIALGTAISVLFVTETYATSSGMGYYIMDAWMRVSYLEMYAAIALLGLLGLTCFLLLDLAEYILCPYRR